MRIASIAVVALLSFLVLRFRMKTVGAGAPVGDPRCEGFVPTSWTYGSSQGFIKSAGRFAWCGYEILRVNPETGESVRRRGVYVIGASAPRVETGGGGGGGGGGGADEDPSEFQQGLEAGWTWMADYIKDWLK